MLTPRTHLLLLLLTALLVGGPFARAEDWLMKDGSRQSGDYVRAEPGMLVINREGKDIRIDAKQLAPQSIERVKEIKRAGHIYLQWTFVHIPAGRIYMGINENLLQGSARNMKTINEDEPYRTAVTSKSFLIKATEVTWAEWNKVLEFADKFGYRDIGTGRNGYRGDEEGAHPVTEVSWMDAVKWCNLFSEVEGRTPVYRVKLSEDKPGEVLRAGQNMDVWAAWDADGYRLPTEAEWEYAWTTKGVLHRIEAHDGWHLENSEGNTHPVSTRESASSKELDDMLGNVAEWCWDWKGPVGQASRGTDPRGPEKGTHRIFRGGSWAEDRMCARGGYRGDFSPVLLRMSWVGFRPVRTVSNKK